MTTKEIQNISEKHGLTLTEEMSFNELGIDFKVGFSTDITGR
jgi:macrolide phosphotransferase